MIDYTPAAEFAAEVRAFAIVESNENESTLGDGHQAFGILQMHPATFKRLYGAQMRFAPNVNDTWTEAQIKCCATFLAAHTWRTATQAERDLIVQAWNLGESGVFIHGRRNPDYLVRWLAAYDRVKGLSGAIQNTRRSEAEPRSPVCDVRTAERKGSDSK